MWKTREEAILDHVVEITWLFEYMEKSKKIKDFNTLVGEYENGSIDVKKKIAEIAEAFEDTYPFESLETYGAYIVKIANFAEHELRKEFGW